VLTKALDPGIRDLRVRVELLVHVFIDVNGVIVTESALEDDNVKGGGRFHLKRVFRVL
jgi:hypothetical protein